MRQNKSEIPELPGTDVLGRTVVECLFASKFHFSYDDPVEVS